MKISIVFSTDNAAFKDCGFMTECCKILDQAMDKIKAQRKRQRCLCTALESADKLLDTNGNTVGTLTIKEE